MLMGTPDRQAIRALNPRAVVGYLRGHGWEKKRDFGPNAAIFGTSIDGADRELLVPLAQQAPDYQRVMEVMIADLNKVEDRSPYELITDLSMAAFDVIRIRSPDADDIGSIRLTAGVELHENAQDMVLYAANVVAAKKPRAAWRGRRAEEVSDYLNALRLGQSQRGSFVISLLSPWDFIPAAEREQADLSFIDPFGRRVTKTLGRALEGVKKALQEAATEGVQRPFQAVVQDGVSANLCHALAQIARDGEGADISVRWSLTQPGIGEPTLHLVREDAQSLTEAAQRLAEVEPLPEVAVQGHITNLKEEPRAFDGVTTIDALVEGRMRRVFVTFAKDDAKIRDALIDAFKHRKRISFTGELSLEGRRLRLENPRDLSVLPQTDEEDFLEAVNS
jgi:hypothetical protein